MHQKLARQWAGKPSWTVLDLSLDGGQCFADLRRSWNEEATEALLHYVFIAQDLPAARAFLDALPEADDPAFQQIFPGLNRLLPDTTGVSLTVCVGPVFDMLTELRMQADTVFLSPQTLQLADADFKQLALNCRPQAQIHLFSTSGLDTAAFARHGFELQCAPDGYSGDAASASFTPRWALKRNRRIVNQAISASRCAVIGAGLSGAAVAQAMALRGWQVTVYDTHIAPAGGASGLPAGLCVAQNSLDQNPYTRLSRQGVRVCLSHARRLLTRGRDWQPSGVLEKVDLSDPGQDVFHSHAAWLKPASLVGAWLNHARIRFAGGSAITGLARSGAHWTLQGRDLQEIGSAELVVFANAAGSKALIESIAGQVTLAENVLSRLGALQAVHGSMSYGPDKNSSPLIPVNGSGSWITGVPQPDGNFWYAGASYEVDPQRLQADALQHASNLQRLRALCDTAASAMAASLADNTVGLWRGTRCVTHDRLPLVGPLEATPGPTLWICAGMGSRGLSLAALCAELLAALIHSEPLPLEQSLSKRLLVNRPVRGRQTGKLSDLAD